MSSCWTWLNSNDLFSLFCRAILSHYTALVLVISVIKSLSDTSTAKNLVISPDFLVLKFCGKAQFPHSFRQFARKYAETVTARKTIFSLSKCSEKIIFPKNFALEYNLSCIVRKDDISFPKKYNIFFRQKMKDDLSQKKYMEIYIFQMFWKDGLSKKLRWNMIFLISWGKMAFLFPENIIFFLRTKNERWSFSKIHGNMMFSVCW